MTVANRFNDLHHLTNVDLNGKEIAIMVDKMSGYALKRNLCIVGDIVLDGSTIPIKAMVFDWDFYYTKATSDVDVLEFVVAHELGHVNYGHTVQTTWRAMIRQEIEADKFAMVRRNSCKKEAIKILLSLQKRSLQSESTDQEKGNLIIEVAARITAILFRFK